MCFLTILSIFILFMILSTSKIFVSVYYSNLSNTIQRFSFIILYVYARENINLNTVFSLCILCEKSIEGY
jgi:hypothetical protein